MGSGATEMIDAKGYVTAQCWSPDGQEIVYETDQTLRVYDVQEKKSRTLAEGRYATWSPDGNWIASLKMMDIMLSALPGTTRNYSSRRKTRLPALWWSPDSRLVAYVSRNGFFERRLSGLPSSRAALLSCAVPLAAWAPIRIANTNTLNSSGNRARIYPLRASHSIVLLMTEACGFTVSFLRASCVAPRFPLQAQIIGHGLFDRIQLI